MSRIYFLMEKKDTFKKIITRNISQLVFCWVSNSRIFSRQIEFGVQDSRITNNFCRKKEEKFQQNVIKN